MIHDSINKELTEAMRARDEIRLSVIRDLKTSFVNELVTISKKPDDKLDDDSALKVIRRKVNQRKDSIEQYEKAGREELVEQEKAELEVLERYLPAQLSDEELEKLVEVKKQELGVTEKKDVGRLIGAVVKEVGPRADGSRVQKVAQTKLS